MFLDVFPTTEDTQIEEVEFPWKTFLSTKTDLWESQKKDFKLEV